MNELLYARKQKLLKDYQSWMRFIDEKHDNKCKAVTRCDLSDAELVYISLLGRTVMPEDTAIEGFIRSLFSLNISLSIVYQVVNGKVSIKLGCKRNSLLTVQSMAEHVLGLECEKKIEGENEIFSRIPKYKCEAAIVGDFEKKKDKSSSGIDTLILRGDCMNYALVMAIQPLSSSTCTHIAEFFDNKRDALNHIVSRQITSRNDMDSESYSEEVENLNRFKSVLDKFQKKYDEGAEKGLFISSIKVYADNWDVVDFVSSVFVSNYSGGEYPEHISRIQIEPSGMSIDARIYSSLEKLTIDSDEINMPLYSNYLTASELAFVLDFPTKDSYGFYQRIIPEFDIARNVVNEDINLGMILDGSGHTGLAPYYMPLSDMNRNALVCGLVGAGKTNTVFHVINELISNGIPILVIENEKNEYYPLAERLVPDLQIVSVGERDNNLVINPFQPVDTKISLQQHIDSFYSALMAAFEWVEPMPHTVEDLIYKCYADNGFDLENDENNYENTNYPTIEQMYWEVKPFVESKGFDKRLESDVIGCIRARLNSLRLGNKGRSLNVKKSMDLHSLFSHNTLIELNVQDEEVRSFIIGLLLTDLREHCMLRETQHLGLSHYTVIEEAHSLLKKIDASSGSAQAKGVKVFSRMLKTLRGKGEGFMIIDQVPSELEPNCTKNTNLKIIHRIVAADDKELLGAATNSSKEQTEFQAVLRRGEAIVHSEGDIHPKLVKIPFVPINCNAPRESILKTHGLRTNAQQLYNINPHCLNCPKEECVFASASELEARFESFAMKWRRRLIENNCFEDFFTEAYLFLNREGYMSYKNCFLAKISNILYGSEAISKKYDFCNTFRKWEKDYLCE